MTDPISNVGNPQITPAARINDVGWQQLEPLLSILTRDLASYASPDQLAVLIESFRLVVSSRLPALDVAASMYSNPAALDALREGNPETAKQAVISQLSEALAELRASGVPEANLRMLSAAGFAASEISSALRTVPVLQNALTQNDAAQLKQMLPTLHEMFRDDGRSAHGDPPVLSALGERMLGGAQATWFDQYTGRIRAAQKRSIGPVRQEDLPELMLYSGAPPAPIDETSASLGFWMIAIIVGIAILLILVPHC
jgi:hypothetical protein